ncbi:MAG: LPS export ABC transporter periplasmic protein LptC [Elusimicrobiaceae bacterium]|nr:LPS export ABC transporter periplasmic protein LptC [Elusimicrobiaceae bacterium]
MKRFVFFLGLVALVGTPLWSAPRTLPAPEKEDGIIYFSADEASAEPSAKKINLKGNVHIVQQTPDGQLRTATGEDITFDQLNTTISSKGPMKVEGMGGTVEGNNVSVNYQTKDFYAENIQTEYPPLRILSAQSISSDNGTQRLKKAVLTCCDLTPPHYTITLGNLKVSPEKRLFGTNAVFRLGNVPVMWLPVYWRSLESKKPWTTYVDFTQSNDTGFGLLTSNVLTEVPIFRPKINLDYYTKSGVGMGLELMAKETETLKGTGEVYYINDHAEPDKDRTVDGHPFQLQNTKRWGIRGGYWWEMYDSSDHFNNPDGALYQFQTQFRMVSDPYFNDSFFRGNPYIFMPDQQTNFSLSRQSRKSTLRVSYTQQDIFDWKKGDFIAQERNLPQLEYTILPFKDPLLGLTHHMELQFNNTSLMEESWHRQGNARWTTEKSIRISRNLTFLPSIFYDQHVTLEDPQYQDKNAWVGRVGTKLNMQTNTLLGSTDFGYEYTRRLSTGTIHLDHTSADRGEEVNRLYIQNYFRPTFQTYIRLGAGFSLINHDGQEKSWQHLKQRIEPFLAEAGYTTSNGAIHLFVRDLYDIAQHNQALIAQSNFSFWGQYLALGMSNFQDHIDASSRYQTFSDRYFFTSLLGLHFPNTSWQVSLGTDFQLEKGSLQAYNKLLRLTKHFHDATAEITVRDRNDNLSFAFRINILCGQDKNAQKKTQSQDQYYYPWRSENDLRDM